MQTSRGYVDGQLANSDLDAADALVTDSEDAFGVGCHEKINIVTVQAVVAQRLLDSIWVVYREVDPMRPAVFVAVLFDRLADGWCIDDRQHLLQMLGQQPVEQDLITVSHIGQEDVLGKIILLPQVLRIHPAQLPFECRDTTRQ